MILTWLLALALVFISAGAINVLANVLFSQRVRRLSARALQTTPMVSVLIPARNEAHNVAACVRSLLAQDYPAYEVIALNDDSTDETGSILEQLAAHDARLRVLHNHRPLPPGVNGKSRACQQLAEAARGEWLLFVDADTVHRADSIRRGVAAAHALKVALFSVIPQQTLGTWAERLFIPAGFAMILNVVSFWRMRYSPDCAWGNAAAVGQYVLVRRDAYFACGGHRAIQDKILDDVALGEQIKRSGYRIALADADWVRCRMYRSGAEMIAGFSKNAFAILRGSLVLSSVFVLGSVGLFYAPLVGLLLGIAQQQSAWLVLSAASIALTLADFALVNRRIGQPLRLAALYPVQIAIGLGILLNSIRWRYTGRAQWKGRSLVGAS